MRTISCLLLLLLLPSRSLADERWYILTISGVPVGWISEEHDGARTRVVMSARLTRLGKSIDMRFDTLTTEEAGALARLEYEALLSKQPVRVTVHANGRQFTIASGTSERAIDGGSERVIGPAAIAILTTERLRAVDDSVSFAMFSPEFQKVVSVRRRLVARSDVSPCGGAAANRIEESIEGLPAPRTIWMDGEMAMIGDTIASPFGPMSTCRSSKAAALAASGTLPADLYERTLARSNVRFADPFAVDRIVLRIRPRERGQVLPDFTAHNQRQLEPGLVEVRRPSPGSTSGTPAPAAEYLASNALIESGHADIAAIARSLKKDTAFETANALTAWTADHMTMDGGIVMAPASELVRDRRATCMGYATLLAALARASSIPSRVALGFVYYGGIWGGHAWTEMFLDGQWLPFDAAVYAPGVASAMRLSVGTSSLLEGGASLNGALLTLFGKVDVDTVEYGAGGRVVTVNPDQPPYQVDGQTYANTGLGIRVRAAGFTIERADTTWPSTLVVAFRRHDTVVELHQRPAYPERPQPPGTVFAAERVGGTLLLWIARGPDAAAALRDVLDRVERRK